MAERSLATAPRTPGVIAGRIFIYTLLGIAALYFLLPFLIVVMTSLKTMEDIRMGTLISLPREITFDAWGEAWSSACIGVNCQGIKGYFVNSIKMVIPAVHLHCPWCCQRLRLFQVAL